MGDEHIPGGAGEGSQGGTVPLQRAQLPVRQVRVDVTSGPDKGMSASADAEPLRIGSGEGNQLRLTDPTVSRYHCELMRRGAVLQLTDAGSTNGTGVGPITLQNSHANLRPPTTIRLGQSELRVDDGEVVMVGRGPSQLGGLLGRTSAARALMSSAQRVAASDVAVLLCGESGTGKELLARAIHDQSARSARPFVTLDCGALTPGLLSSELFGHERGAFTGADRKHLGVFERAVGGTLFLDEIGELPPQLQTSLLGVLERGRFRRVGGDRDVEVDVRIVSATHRNLRAAVNRGDFRLDLFYRLSVVLLEVPSLRERAEDVPLLIEHFLQEAGCPERMQELFPDAELQRLSAHEWPGNVRELRNIVLATTVMGTVPPLGRGPGEANAGADLDLPYKEAKALLLEDFEAKYLQRLLERSEGNIRKAARVGDMNRSHLMDLLKRHGLR